MLKCSDGPNTRANNLFRSKSTSIELKTLQLSATSDLTQHVKTGMIDFWERLIVNIGIVFVFGAFCLGIPHASMISMEVNAAGPVALNVNKAKFQCPLLG